MTGKRWMAGLALGVMLVGPWTAAPARGQGAPDSITPIPLDTLTVTVLRTPSTAREAPYAVAVRTARELERGQPGLELDETLRGIPGVQVDNRYNYALGERIAVRGFGARAQFGVRGVKVLVDGIPATLPDGQTTISHVDPAVLGRVEVIRGPASALYGNAAGGVIQLETKPAPPGRFRQEIRVVGGANGLLRLGGTTGGRSGSTAYRLDVSRFTYGGFREYSATENLHANARLTYRGDGDELRIVANFVDYDAQNPGSLAAEQLAEDRSQAHGYNRVQQTGEAARQGQLGVRWRRGLGAGTLELTAYGLARQLENPIPPAIIELERVAAGLRSSYRAEAAVGAGTLRWAVGVEGDLQADDRRNFGNDQGERGPLTLDQAERVRSTGVFGHLVVPVATDAEVLGGVRYDRFRFAVEDRRIGPDDPDDSGERTLDAVSPSLGLRVGVAPEIDVYANLATAFETPTTTELANRPTGAGGFNPDLEPQRTVSVEVGAKGRAGGRVRYELTLYRARVEDALIPFEVPDVPGRQFFRNAGSAVHRGVEAGAAAHLTTGVTARLAYAYTDARFDAYSVDGTSYDGNRVPGVAPHRLDAGLGYTAAAGWFGDLEVRHGSEMAVNDENTATSPAYTVVDLRAGRRGLDLGPVKADAFLGVNNLFDAEYNASVVVNAFGGRYYEPAPGRSVYAGVEVRFGGK